MHDDKLSAESLASRKALAEIEKLLAETSKIELEKRAIHPWYASETLWKLVVAVFLVPPIFWFYAEKFVIPKVKEEATSAREEAEHAKLRYERQSDDLNWAKERVNRLNQQATEREAQIKEKFQREFNDRAKQIQIEFAQLKSNMQKYTSSDDQTAAELVQNHIQAVESLLPRLANVEVDDDITIPQSTFLKLISSNRRYRYLFPPDPFSDSRKSAISDAFGDIDASEGVVAYVDLTIGSKDSDFIVFTSKGIYYQQSGLLAQSKGSMTYDEFLHIVPKPDSYAKLDIGNGDVIDISGARIGSRDFISFLDDLKEAILNESI